ncbi:L,D-transpeptidase [Segnochrobactraceae bacterium EtOH-i3]
MPPLRRTTSELETPAAPALMAEARTATQVGLRETSLPASGQAITSTAAIDPPTAARASATEVKEVKKSSGSKWKMDPKFLPTVISYEGPEKPGTLIIDTEARFLYLVESDGQARRYGVGVGRPGFEWAGKHRVTRKAEWPDWRPPPEMRKRQPKLPAFMPGGPRNPLGARALYLGSTIYRIHGSNEPWSIGRAVSSGCIRMRNEDVTDLYNRVPVGATVIVR